MTRSPQGESKQSRRAFSTEFKLEAVRLLRERKALGVSVAQIGRELDLRPDMLRRWARQLDPQGRGARADGPLANPEAEVRRLARENAVLRQEREFLKKAAAFFAKESR